MYKISNEIYKIDYMPKTSVEEVLQNGRTILSTFAGTVPLMREFAQDWSLIDKKSTEVTNILMNKLVPLFNKYEPRLRLRNLEIKLKEGNETNGSFYITAGVEVIV
jgi:phage baseplate assembly protein W